MPRQPSRSTFRALGRTALLIAALFTGCALRPELRPETEVVLTPGMSVRADTPAGLVTITAGESTARTFSGPGWQTTQHLTPRQTRWYGSLGLYDPASSYSPYGRLLADEGRLFFDSESDALRYLYVGSTYMKPIFTNDGLVVGYRISPIPGGAPARSVQLWQIYIRGQKPHHLRGARDSAITLTGGTTPDRATPYPAPVGYVSTPGEREYTPPPTPY